MTCTITLYKDAKIIPSKNFIVEGIENYLSTLTHIELTKFQYIRNDLNLTIKINKSQTYTEINSTYNYNYVKVYQNSIAYYYFVMKKTQISQDTIALELLMDTLNTFSWDSGYKVSPRTRVIREHKNRLASGGRQVFDTAEFADISTAVSSYGDGYRAVITLWESELEWEDDVINAVNAGNYTGWVLYVYDRTDSRYLQEYEYGNIESFDLQGDLDTHTIVVSGFIQIYNTLIEGHDLYITLEADLYAPALVRKIDYYPEGINPVLYKQELGELRDSSGLEWNLIYRNHTSSADTAIDCYILPTSGEIQYDVPDSDTLTYTDFEDGKYYIFAPFNNESQTLTDQDSNTYFVGRVDGGYYACRIVKRTGTTLQMLSIRYSGLIAEYDDEFPGAQVGDLIAFQQIKYSWKTITSLTFSNSESLPYMLTDSLPVPSIPLGTIIHANGFFSGSIDTTEDLYTLDSVDRSDTQLVKIIAIPYFPSYNEYNTSTNVLKTDNLWTYESSLYHSLFLNNLNAQFTSTIVSKVNNPLNVFKISRVNPTATDLRNDLYESKLFHSEFYQPKFVYDSFGFVFELEKINETAFNPSSKFTFEFIMTSTINSKFMFKFPEYVLKLSTEDFDNILTISRNNEATIYNSAYITYLRTAYRYDLKKLEQEKQLLTFNMSSKYIWGMGEAIMQGYGGTYAKHSEGGYFSSAKTIWNSAIVNVIDSIAKGNELEWSMKRTLESLKAQSASVSGSDDLDLMRNYCGNVAKLCLYTPSERMKKLVSDLLYYYGYATDEIKKPLTDTRYWFNFLQCELELTGVDNNITQILKDNIISRFATGATFLHNHSNTWDFDQVKENWESSLLS